MKENELLEKLGENINNLSKIENQISMIELELYQKTAEQLKEEKKNELSEYFKQQASFCGQDISAFKEKMETNQEKFEKLMDTFIKTYDELYIQVFTIRQSAMANQKIAVANIVTLNNRLKETADDRQKEEIQSVQLICAKKKLDYSVMIDECSARIRWCSEEMGKDFEEIFSSKTKQLQIYEENIFIKLRRKLFNKFCGKNKFEKILQDWLKKDFSEKKQKVSQKIFEVAATAKGVEKQMEMVREQIAEVKKSEF